MPILDSEIIWRASQLLSYATPAQNGGRLNTTEMVTGVTNNFFHGFSQSERTADGFDAPVQPSQAGLGA